MNAGRCISAFSISLILIVLLCATVGYFFSFESIAIIFLPVFIFSFYHQEKRKSYFFAKRLIKGEFTKEDEAFADNLSSLSLGMGFLATFFGLVNIFKNLPIPEQAAHAFAVAFHGIFLGIITPLVLTFLGAFKSRLQLMKIIFYIVFLAPFPILAFYLVVYY